MPKKIIILVTVLVGAFIASCGLTLLLGGGEQEPASQPAASQTDEDGAPGRSGFPLPAVGAAEQRQLQDLVNEPSTSGGRRTSSAASASSSWPRRSFARRPSGWRICASAWSARSTS